MTRRVLRPVAALAVMMGMVLAARLPTPWLLVEPGTVAAVEARLFHASGLQRGGPFWLVTVAARPARAMDLGPALTDPRKALWSRTVLGPGPVEEIASRQRDALLASQKAAVEAAARWRGLPSPPQVDFAAPGDVGGPSGGLAFALAALDALSSGSLAGGCRVAATGTVTPAGDVGPVAGIPQKMAAAREAGIAVFFRPSQPGPDERDRPRSPAGAGALPARDAAGSAGRPVCAAPRGQPAAAGDSMRVVPVASLGEAVRWLCNQGGDDALCTP